LEEEEEEPEELEALLEADNSKGLGIQEKPNGPNDSNSSSGCPGISGTVDS
jgi:hypothetical protein